MPGNRNYREVLDEPAYVEPGLANDIMEYYDEEVPHRAEVQTENRIFWMVYTEGGSSPTMKHFIKDDAINEAKRLTKRTKRRTCVLEATDILFLPDSEPIVIQPIR